jgi:hypothetical protein
MTKRKSQTRYAKTVTDLYLLGIREGREMSAFLNKTGEPLDIPAILKNLETNLKRGFSREMSDVFRGERDFWKHQQRKMDTP